MPVKGLTQRTIFRMKTRHFRDSVKIEKQTGRSNGVPTWLDLGDFNGLYDESSSIFKKPEGSAQAYDGILLLIGAPALTERGASYRLTIEKYKAQSENEYQEGPPVLKRTRVVEVMDAEPIQDAGGADLLQIVRCQNARISGTA